MLKVASVSSKPAVKLVTLTSAGDGDGTSDGNDDGDRNGDGDRDDTRLPDGYGVAEALGARLPDRVGDGEKVAVNDGCRELVGVMLGVGEAVGVVDGMGEAELLTAGDGAKMDAQPMMATAGTLPEPESAQSLSWTAQLVTIETDGVGDNGDQGTMIHDE
jgi:hypothetical protein